MGKWTSALLLVAGLLAAENRAAEVTLVANGQTAAVIVISADELKAAGPVAASALDLQRCLKVMTGAEVAVVNQMPAADGKLVPILVGSLAAERFGPPAQKSPYQQGWRLVVRPDGVGFIGESPEAVSYAVYELLDRLGCRWYIPSALGEVIPQRATVALPEADVSGIPDTIYRNIWYCDNDYRRRNRLGGLLLAAGHALEGYLTPAQRKEHPDWCAEVNGKREPAGSRVCWGNLDVADAMADNIIAMLDKQYRPSVSLSPGDGIDFCQCEKCRAKDAGDWDPSIMCPAIADRLVQFCNRIAERVTAKHPHVLFGMLAYAQYTRPPLREKLHPNLVPQLAPITYCRAHSMLNADCPSRHSVLPILEGWGKKAEMLSMYHYAYNLAEVSVPFPMMRQWSEELPLCFKNHVKFWQPETMPNFASTAPGLYLGIRLSWNNSADPQAILDDFFTGFYGAAAGPMREHWQVIDDAWHQVPEHAGCGFGHLRRFTPERLAAIRAPLERAKAACKTETETKRVELADASLREFELFMKLRRDLVAGRVQNVKTEADQWLATWKKLMADYGAQYAFSPYAASYFSQFFNHTYQDTERLAVQCDVMTVLNEWRWRLPPEKQPVPPDWKQAEFADADWKTTRPAVDTWASLDLYSYYGPMVYRTRVTIPAPAANQDTWLWVGATDGSLTAFVNGQQVSFVGKDGKPQSEFNGYCQPVSFRLTEAIKPGVENQLTLIGTRGFLNELGTGGIIGPVYLYRDKPAAK